MLTHNTVGILLAAGTGRRFDPTGVANKLCQPLSNGRGIAEQAAITMRGVLPRVIAVVSNNEVGQQLAACGCDVLLFADAAESDRGMGASLAYATRHIGDADSVLVGLADMPYIKEQTLRDVRQA